MYIHIFFFIYDKHFFKVCPKGQYGQKCSFRCGNCLDEEPCHHINGTCISGCLPGWKGEWCDQSEFLNYCHKDYEFLSRWSQKRHLYETRHYKYYSDCFLGRL